MLNSKSKQPKNEQNQSISYAEETIVFKSGQVTEPFDHIWNHELFNEYNFLHAHNCIEVGICINGSGIWHINGAAIPFSGPTYTLIMPGVWHSAHTTESKGSTWNFVYVKDSELLLNCFLDGETLVNRLKNKAFIVKKDQDPATFDLIESFVNISSQDIDNKDKILSNTLKSILMIKCNEVDDLEPVRKDLTFILPAINYINTNYSEKIDLNYIADLCCCSLSSLRRYFIKATGLSPYQYIESVRLNIARDMLMGQKKILYVALDCGYPSISCFNKQFKKVYGITPKEYQKAHTHDISSIN